ncbi:MAG: acyl carrier protein [Myxococcota bacterium]|nr:acyl carrier protein [Myxococcota bacterium]
MTSDEILKGLQTVARDHLDFEGDLDPKASIVNVLELDSIRMLTLVVEVENHFQICLEEGDEQELVTASDLVEVIRRRVHENAG